MLNKVLLSCSIAIAFVLATTACSSADVPKNPNPPAPASTPVLAPTKTYNQLLPATPIAAAALDRVGTKSLFPPLFSPNPPGC